MSSGVTQTLSRSRRTGPLGSVRPDEFHFMEEQKKKKHQTLAIELAVISHVSLLYIYSEMATHV